MMILFLVQIGSLETEKYSLQRACHTADQEKDALQGDLQSVRKQLDTLREEKECCEETIATLSSVSLPPPPPPPHTHFNPFTTTDNFKGILIVTLIFHEINLNLKFYYVDSSIAWKNLLHEDCILARNSLYRSKNQMETSKEIPFTQWFRRGTDSKEKPRKIIYLWISWTKWRTSQSRRELTKMSLHHT